MAESNWARNVTLRAERVHHPTAVDDIRRIVRDAQPQGRQVHAAGTRHSFSTVADTSGDLVSMERMNRVLDIDHAERTVTVEAGIRYGDLCPVLEASGLALGNLPSLPHITVAGAVSTGTHGSGDLLPNLSAAVMALEMVDASGEIVRLTRDHDGERLAGAVVALGALGVVTSVTLAVEPTFEVAQDVFVDLPFDEVVEHLDEVMGTTDSVSPFTTWQSDTFHQVWCKRRIGESSDTPTQLLDAERATSTVHMVNGVSAAACTEQHGAAGPWHERLPHFRLDFTPSVGAELQTEYFVDRDDGPSALRAVRDVADLLAPLIQVTEIRSIAMDDLWLSPAFGRDSLALHFTWHPDQAAVMAVLPELESVLADFGPRPHWGKLTAMSPDDVRSAYSRFDDFAALVGEFDPTGTFRNSYLERLLA